MSTTPAFIASSVNLLKRELMEYNRDKNVRRSKLPQGADISFLCLGHPIVASAYVSDCVDQLDEVCRDSVKNCNEQASIDAISLFQTKMSVEPIDFAESLLEFVLGPLKEHFAALAEQAMRAGISSDMVLFLGSLTHLKIAFMSYEQTFETAGLTRSVTVLMKCCRVIHSMILQYSKLTASVCFRRSVSDLQFLDLSEYRDAIQRISESKKEVLDVLPKDIGTLVVDDLVDKSLMLFSCLLSTLRLQHKDVDRFRAFLLLSICDYSRLVPSGSGKSRMKILQLLSVAASIYSPLSSVCQVVFEPQTNRHMSLEQPSINWINSVVYGSEPEGNFHLQLFELFGQTRVDVPKLLFVMINQDLVLSRLIVAEVFRKNLPDCDSSFSQFFRCLVFISENNFHLWESVYSRILFEQAVDLRTWETLNRKELWVSTKPAWFEAIVSFLGSYTKPVVADIIATLPPPNAKPTKISVKFEKMVKRAVSTVTKQLSIIPLGLVKLFVELGRVLPATVSPVGGSIALHFGICSTYRQLMNGEGIGTRSDADFVRNLLLAVAERLCLCADSVYSDYGKQIEEALKDRLKSDYCEKFVKGLDEVNLFGYCTSMHSSLYYRKEDIEALEATFKLLKRNQGWIERKLEIIQRVKGLEAEWNVFSLDVTSETNYDESLRMTRQIVFASKFPSAWKTFVSQILSSSDVSHSGFKKMLANRWEFTSAMHADADAAVVKALKACDKLNN